MPAAASLADDRALFRDADWPHEQVEKFKPYSTTSLYAFAQHRLQETGMTPMPAQPPATTALSPYLSLRQAVRPAIVTYTVLASEQERAGALAEEASQLLEATRKLLEAVGLVHLLSPKPGEEMPGNDRGDRQARLLAAYADAGMLWAKVVGHSIALADGLLGQARWDDVLRLADFLDNAGETVVADSLRERANDAIRGDFYARINRIHDKMSREETATAIDTLRSLPRSSRSGSSRSRCASGRSGRRSRTSPGLTASRGTRSKRP